MTFSLRDWIRDNLKGDRQIWWVVLFLSIMSVLVVYSATGTMAYQKMEGNTEMYLFKHGGLVVLGLAFMFFAHKINYLRYAHLSRFGLWLSIPLLLWAFFKGTNLNDASRWVTIPIINQTFQPSDLAKLSLISNLAFMLSKRQGVVYEPRVLVNLIFWIGTICALIALSNTSTALLLGLTCFLLMYIGRVPTNYLIGMVVVCLVLGGIGLGLGQRLGTATNRIKTFVSQLQGSAGAKQLKDADDPTVYQQHQGYIAMANGGIYGQGPGQSHQRNFLPHPYSDFIFAIIVEEYGLIGGIAVVVAYLWLLARGLRALRESKGKFGGLLSAGLTFSIVLQAIINMAVAVGIAPVTGLPLPLLSMGGTSLLFTGTAIGIVLSVSRDEADESKL
jgi:cell division protein FtsW